MFGIKKSQVQTEGSDIGKKEEITDEIDDWVQKRMEKSKVYAEKYMPE